MQLEEAMFKANKRRQFFMQKVSDLFGKDTPLAKDALDTEIYMCQQRPDIMLEDRAAEAY